MTVSEAILTLNANILVACGRAGFSSATIKMTEDALDTIENALHAQEPRLVTEADFENADEDGFIPVWCEVMDNEFDPFVIKDYWNCIPIDALETAKEDGYRYWTSKPSLKQMEETPWN